MRDGSALRRALCDELGPDTVIRPFPWGGWNRVRTRAAAARALEVHVRALLDAHPTAKHFIVAHSHGGAVALMALTDPRINARISGVACLATPFLHVRRRLFAHNYGSLAALLSVAFVVWWERTVGVYLQAAVPALYTNLFGHTAVVLAGAAPLFAAAVFGLRRWYRVAERVRSQCRLPELATDRVLILRADGDEASGLLGLLALASAVPGRLWARGGLAASRLVDRYASRASGYVRKVFAWLAGGLAAAALIGFGAGLQFYTRGVALGLASIVSSISFVGAILTLVPLGYLAGWTLHTLLGALAVVLLPWWLLCYFLFGWELALVAPFLDVYAESTPPGRWVVHHFSSPEPGLREDAGTSVVLLKHSEIYSNPEALRGLASWMRTR